MQLKLLGEHDWYAKDGLRFSCTQCGNCCTGGPGVVWISKEEIVRLADFLKISPEETVERYCRKIDGQFSLVERQNRQGQYDCIFLTDGVPVDASGDPGKVRQRTRGCSIYPVRPLQCRTWPFWPEVVASERAWNEYKQKCPGMDVGRKFPAKKVNALRDAKDWP